MTSHKRGIVFYTAVTKFLETILSLQATDWLVDWYAQQMRIQSNVTKYDRNYYRHVNSDRNVLHFVKW